MQCPALCRRILSSANSSAGFTLIELMISVGILTVLSAAMIPSFNSYINSQNVNQATEQIKSDMRSVQNKALTGAGFVRNSTTHWGMKFVDGSNTYSWKIFTTADPVTSSTCNNSWSGVETSTPFASDVALQGSGSPRCIFFNFTNADVTFYEGNTPITCSSLNPSTNPNTSCNINVRRGSSGECKYVVANTPGLIATSNTTTSCTN